MIKMLSFKHFKNVNAYAKIIDGTQLAKNLKDSLANDIKKFKENFYDHSPGLAIIQVGDRQDSNVYIRMKLKSASEVGIEAHHVKLPSSITQSQLLNNIIDLNNNINIHGIILQLPLDCINVINTDDILKHISIEKDVDGLHPFNSGQLAHGITKGIFLPCTPNGCIQLIKSTGVDIAGKRAVVIGRSKIVGTPMAELLKWHNATVTVCHSRTQNIDKVVAEADILVAALGSAQFVKKEWIKPGAIVIDCGINAISDESKKCGYRLLGDVDFDHVAERADFITPVPGGVGPMTVCMLLINTYQSALRFANKYYKDSPWSLTALPLNVETPVPHLFFARNVQISQAHQPKLISLLAEEINLLPNEYQLYGNYKAKLSLDIIQRLKHVPNGHYVIMTGMTPTSSGEGKSTTTIALCQSLTACLDRKAIACVRQPSMGPTFGMKGGASGGGYSQIIPMQDFDIHMTGDIHAVTAANNLLAAAIDARIFHEATQSDSVRRSSVVKTGLDYVWATTGLLLKFRLNPGVNKEKETREPLVLYSHLVPLNEDNSRTFSNWQLKRLSKLGIDKTDPNLLTPEEISRFVRLNIDPDTITINRVTDTNDRFLRQIEIGLCCTEKGVNRRTTRFDISVASELMAILALAQNDSDLRARISRIMIAYAKPPRPRESGDFPTTGVRAITPDDLGITGALCLIMREAIKPNLMQTLQGSPVLVHTGPFANIAHGNSSILADTMALKMVGPQGFVVTEAGFGADIGLEKFVDIKCRVSGLRPSVAIIVATVKAVKLHALPKVTKTPALDNLELIRLGMCNLVRHLENIDKFDIPAIVAINAFPSDTVEELNLIKSLCKEVNGSIFDAVICNHFSQGGQGALPLAQALIKLVETCANKELQPTMKFLYPLDMGIEDKIRKIAMELYRASDVSFTQIAKEKIVDYEKMGLGKLPICMAKTPLSFTHDPSIKGCPEGFILPISDIRASVGAGFLYPLVGSISTMPGLPTRPAFYDIDIDPDTGKIYGLF